jgi:hypothetical protein
LSYTDDVARNLRHPVLKPPPARFWRSSVRHGGDRVVDEVSFAVQARLVVKRGRLVVRDETRLATAGALGDAVAEARRLAADGFTVWVFRVDSDARQRPSYTLTETLRPAKAAARQLGGGQPARAHQSRVPTERPSAPPGRANSQ